METRCFLCDHPATIVKHATLTNDVRQAWEANGHTEAIVLAHSHQVPLCRHHEDAQPEWDTAGHLHFGEHHVG